MLWHIDGHLDRVTFSVRCLTSSVSPMLVYLLDDTGCPKKYTSLNTSCLVLRIDKTFNCMYLIDKR